MRHEPERPKASIKQFKKVSVPDRQLPWYTNPKELVFPNDKDSQVTLFVVPDRMPEPLKAQRSLAELYYTTQTMPLTKLLPAAHKTLNTDVYQLSLLEGKLAVVHARIEELKRSEKWSLRQRAKFHGPGRAKVHWDRLLDEMKWMRSDFSEERKLKIALCYEMAQSVKDYWTYGKEACCIKPRPIVHLPEEKLEDAEAETKMEIEAAPETTAEGADKMEVDQPEPSAGAMKEPPQESGEAIDPRKLETESVERVFDSLIPRVFVTENDQKSSLPLKLNINVDGLNAASKELYDRLPVQQMPEFKTPYSNEFDSLAITSITKFLAAPELNPSWQRLVIEVKSKPSPVEESKPAEKPKNTDGSLFGHESHKRYLVIKPPQPPNLKYLEARTPTIWLPQDDQKLLRYSKEYQFNWSIISAMFVSETVYTHLSNIERRTPWQCFERWLQLTPNFQLSDLKGPYAHQAQAWLEASLKAQTVTKRRISPLGVGVESIQRGHRRLRWASMFDGIRKSMRSRENMARVGPQVHRKFMSGESTVKVPTPAELSKLKYEKERMDQQQRNPMAGGAGGVGGVGVGGVGGPAIPGARPTPVGAAGQAGGNPAQQGPGGAGYGMQRPNSGGQPGQAGGNGGGSSQGAQGNHMAQQKAGGSGMPALPAGLPAGMRLTPEQIQMMQKGRQMAGAQNTKSPQQTAGKLPSQGPGTAGMGGNDAMNSNAANLKRTTSVSDASSPATASSGSGSMLNQLSVSMQNPHQHPHIVNLINQIAAQYPNLSNEQVTQIAQNKIQKYIQLQKQRAAQSAAAAAASGSGAGATGRLPQSQAGGQQQQQVPVPQVQRQMTSQQMLQFQQMQMAQAQAQAQQQQRNAAGGGAGGSSGQAKQPVPSAQAQAQFAMLQQRKIQQLQQQMQLAAGPNPGMPLSPGQQAQLAQQAQQLMRQQMLQRQQHAQQQQQQQGGAGSGMDLDDPAALLGSSPNTARGSSAGITPPPPPPSR